MSLERNALLEEVAKKGSDMKLFNDEELDFLNQNTWYFLRDEFARIDPKLKAGFMFLASMVGLQETGRKWDYHQHSVGRRVLKQTSLIKLSEKDIEVFSRLYDYVWKALNSPQIKDEFETEKYIAATIYDAAHFMFAESFLKTNGPSVTEMVFGELKPNPLADDVLEYFQNRKKDDDLIRIESGLFLERNPELKYLEEYKW